MYLDIQLVLDHGPKCSYKAFGILYASFDAAVGVGRANFGLLNGRAMACSGLQDALLNVCDRRFLVCLDDLLDDNPPSGLHTVSRSPTICSMTHSSLAHFGSTT